MAKFIVFQNHSVRENSDIVNSLGWGGASEKLPGVAAHLKYTVDGGDFEPVDLIHYRPVSVVEAENLEQVFAITNGAVNDPEQYITRLADMHSLSVGDIVHDGENYHMVAMFGFEKLEV